MTNEEAGFGQKGASLNFSSAQVVSDSVALGGSLYLGFMCCQNTAEDGAVGADLW